MMGLYYRLLRNRWIKSFVGVTILAVLIWYFGPLLGIGQLHPFDSTLICVITIALLYLLWLVLNLFGMWRSKKKEKALVAEVSAPAIDAGKIAAAEEMAVLAERLRTALHDLKHAKLGGKSGRLLYQMPWYMFIGPPGAGKTTALTKSGLRFPLADEKSPKALGGVGGTRNCDWWFTDEAVLIDTAGRYTTQDSEAAVDSAAWLGFLRLLKKHRRRQPLNGVLLAISLSDLSELSEAERHAHALAMRRRVRELQDELGVRVPVYVLFTKADLIAGFVEFFDGLGREEREQVWGMTFPLDDGRAEGGAVSGFAAGFDALLARLQDRMLERISQETDVARRRLIYGFPQQVASLRDTAGEFLDEIFRPSRLEARPLLRGVYLTSGTQDGTPIDRLLGAMAGQFGLPRQAVTAFSGTGRSYFLGRLMREVVFHEAGLVSTDARVEARARWIHRGAYAGAAAAVLLFGGFWTMSYVGNLALMAQLHDQARTYAGQYTALAARGQQDTDLPAVLPPLGTLRTLRGGYDDREAATPVSLTFGLYQGRKLNAASVDAYQRGLDAMLLPRLLARLEGEIQASMGKPDALYELLKVYLMLGRQGPLDADLVLTWLDSDLLAAFPADEDSEGRLAMHDHAEAMLELGLAKLPLNGPLIAQAREVLNQEPLAAYCYSRLLRSKSVRKLPEWTVSDNAGPGAGRVFELRSHRKLSSGVPGIYTYEGYHEVFLPILPKVTQAIAEDGWVLGEQSRGIAGTLQEATKMRRGVLGLYLDDYVKVWDLLLADIAVKPFGNVNQGLDELSMLSAPDSPLRDLMQSLDRQTQLSKTGAADKAEGKAGNALAKMGKKAAGFAKLESRMGLSREENEIADVLGEGFGTDAGTGKPVDPATRVDEHFKWLHNFVAGSDGQPSPMETAIGKMGAMGQDFGQVAAAANQGGALLSHVKGGGGGGGGSPATQLQAMAKDMPKPVAAMLETVSKSGTSVTSSGAAQELSDAWRSKVLPLCREAFNRYPFVAGASSDVPPDDFAKLLGPGGLMETFFNDNLAALVDTGSSPWKWQSADHVNLGLSPGALGEFENAAKIRDALFAGGSQMQIKFSLKGTHLDAGLRRVSVLIAGQTMVSDFGPQEASSFQWPNDGKTLVRITMVGARDGQERLIEDDHAWALLHVFTGAGRVIPTGSPDQFQLVFSSEYGNATFALEAKSVRNPFSMRELRSFRCPDKL
jgi:type VI secretion system protein ImpL